MRNPTRRQVLRGLVQGSAVAVALPLLDCFLDGNGQAFASGEPMPQRFGTWFWGLGMNKQAFIPKTVGRAYDLPAEIAPLQAIRERINVFTGFNVFRDGNPNLCHHTGWITLRSGTSPSDTKDFPGQTLDVTLAQKIGSATRFRSLTANATGKVSDSCSYEGQNAINAPEVSPLAFYRRLFGPDFQDPNSATFEPSARVMLEKSVLSGVMENTKKFSSGLGSDDKARLDQYFTSLRDLERQLEHQLKKHDPIPSCVRPDAPPEDPKVGMDVELVATRHRLMTDLLVMAVTCDQTRVFNMAYANPFAATSRVDYDKPHHPASHEEPVDQNLGYQPRTSWFTQRAMEEWCYFVDAFSKVREGDRTLLDNMLIFAHSDQELARTHSIEGIPMFTAGSAGGRVKTGLHVTGDGSAGTRLGYTILRLMGTEVTSWGTQSNRTSKEIGEILV